ncbi:MAG: T9SS type A sorting domain-containing protein [Bacteroidales bacterium]|nr:T9SS type A sorting domain-containing protein [Bacteroidales bacterium]
MQKFEYEFEMIEPTDLATQLAFNVGASLQNVQLKNVELIKIGSAPISSGIYEIATWEDFKTAAVTFTFDDNCTNQFTAAVPLFDNHGYKASFYPVIDWSPNWNTMRTLSQNGHEIGSHGVKHPNGQEQMPENEMSNSKNTINTRITGVDCNTVTYPNCVVPDKTAAAKYFIGGRVCSNGVENKTPADYYAINSLICGSDGLVKTAADFQTHLNTAKNKQGWAVFLIHEINNGSGYSPLESTVLGSTLDYIKQNEPTYWVTTFRNAILYSKERDAATIKELTKTDTEITVSLTDNLADATYKYPLSIRTALPEGWENITATQGTNDIDVRVEGGYIYFSAVPDAGTITIKNGAEVVILPDGDHADGNRLIINEKPLFISGMNIAWNNFGNDVGDTPLDEAAFEDYIKDIRAAGGNAVRWWLHTDAQNCPKLNADGSFNRLGTQTIPNIQKALDIAEEYGVVVSLCLFSFDMMQNGLNSEGSGMLKSSYSDYDIDRNYKFLTIPANLDTYIEGGLKPILAAVGSHPAIMCWEVFNEPEGMTSDRGGWSSQKILHADVLRFTAKIAAEVHRSTTKMASSGIHEFGKIQYYSDAILKAAAGGDPLAYLDFYMAHYYPQYAGTAQSPFHNTAASWGADRPILIGEFPAQSWGPGTNHPDVQPGTAMNIVDAYNYAYDNGYCGLMSWSLTEGDKAKFGSLETTAPALEDLYEKYEDDIKIKDFADVGCSHVFDEWEETTAATCETAGVETEKCSKCGKLGTKTRPVAKLEEHAYGAWSNWSVTMPATCEENGGETRTRTCTLNTEEIDTESRDIPATGHSTPTGVWTSGNAATCTTASTRVEVCVNEGCDHIIATDETAALGHSFGSWIEKTPATCTEFGEETRTCSLCGEVESQPIAKAAHTFTDWEITKPATCGEAGNRTEKCSICGELGIKTEEIPATGDHTFVWIINPDNENEMIEVCSVCGEPSGAPAQPITCTHEFDEWEITTPATCSQEGVKTEKCSKCGVLGTGTEAIAKLPHTFTDWEITKPATCGEAGSRTEKCSICGELGVKTEVIPATGDHTFVWIVNPDNENEEIEVCVDCGELSGAEPRQITCEHDFEWKITTNATCETVGVETQICSKCATQGAVRSIAQLEHSFGNWTEKTAATCSSAGEETRTCSLCGKVESRHIAKTESHTFGNWSVATPATCSELGEETRTCSVCGEIETRPIAKKEHIFDDWQVTQEPTCGVTGSKTEKCSICGELGLKTEIIQTTGEHTFVWITNPDNENEEIEVCAECGEKSGETRPKVCNHNFVWTLTIPATCTATGEETEICSICQAERAIRMIPQLTVGCSQTTYKVTVINGASDKHEYVEGEEVTIFAFPKTEDEDKFFKQWTSLYVTFANEYAVSTTFIMPAQDISVKAVFETRTAIETVAEKAVTVYPNPAKDELKVESGELRIERIEIVNFAGKILINIPFNNTVDVSHLSSGMYMIKMYSNDSVIVRRFVKE